MISWLTGVILLLSFFFVFEPFTNLRIQIGHKPWIVWLPVVGLYSFLALLWLGYRWHNRIDYQKSVGSNREIFIDFARGFAILLSVGSHAFYAFGYDVLFGDSIYKVMTVTRFATPSFVIITGMMFELVYFRKAEKQGFGVMVHSLVQRSVQCYLAYLITVFFNPGHLP